jgi:competence protein ComEC
MNDTERQLQINRSCGTARAPLAWIVLPALTGAMLSMHQAVAGLLWWVLLISGLLLVSLDALKQDNKKVWSVGCWLTGLAVGAIYMQTWLQHAQVEQPGLPPREAVLLVDVQRLAMEPNSFGRYPAIVKVVRADWGARRWENRQIHTTLSIPLDDGMAKGDRIILKGVVREFGTFEFAHGWEAQMLTRGISGQLQHTVVIDQLEAGMRFHSWMRWKHQDALTRLRGREPDRFEARILAAMLLGRRSVLTESERERFLLSGTMHLFAISGLHVGIVAALLHTFLSAIRLKPVWLSLCAILILWLYVELTGAPPSAMRAWLMVSAIWCGRLLLRQATPMPALIAAAGVIFIQEPGQILQLGFQLSYLVVAAILLYAIPLQAMFTGSSDIPKVKKKADRSRWEKFLRTTYASFCISLAAFLISSPLIIATFGIYSPGGILLNVGLVTLAFFAVASGILTLVFGWMGIVFLEVLFQSAGCTLIQVMLELIDISLQLPGIYLRLEFILPIGGLLGSILILISMLISNGLFRRRPLLAAVIPIVIHLMIIILGTRMLVLDCSS